MFAPQAILAWQHRASAADKEHAADAEDRELCSMFSLASL
jgi:hypothetical protein